MPLVGENRTLVKAGLRQLQQTDRPGFGALLEEVGLAGKPITAENISYAIAPRINAAGRMDNAVTALQLVLCEDPDRAEELEMCIRDRYAGVLRRIHPAGGAGTAAPGAGRQGAQQHGACPGGQPVSYTHLDVYKRQGFAHLRMRFVNQRTKENVRHTVQQFGNCNQSADNKIGRAHV